MNVGLFSHVFRVLSIFCLSFSPVYTMNQQKEVLKSSNIISNFVSMQNQNIHEEYFENDQILLFQDQCLHEDNPFLDHLDTDLEEMLPAIPKNNSLQYLKGLLKINENGHYFEEYALALKNFTEVLAVQAKIYDALTILDIAFQEWQKKSDIVKKICFDSERQGVQHLIAYAIHDGNQPIGKFFIYNPEVVLIPLALLDSFSSKEKPIFHITDYHPKVVSTLMGSPNQALSNFGRAVFHAQESSIANARFNEIFLPKTTKLLYELIQTYNQKNLFTQELVTLYLRPGALLQTKSIPPKDKFLTINEKMKPYTKFLTNALFIWTKYSQSLLQEIEKNTFTKTHTVKDNKFFHASHVCCECYKKNKPILITLYDIARRELFSLKRRAKKQIFNFPQLTTQIGEILPASIENNISPEDVFSHIFQERVKPLPKDINYILTYLVALNEQFGKTEKPLIKPIKKQKTKQKKTSSKRKKKAKRKKKFRKKQPRKKSISTEITPPLKEDNPLPEQQPIIEKFILEDDKSSLVENRPTHFKINDPKNNCSIILYKLPKPPLTQFEYKNHKRVKVWFSSPQKALLQQGYTDVMHKNYREEEKHPRIITIHSFAKAVDCHLFSHGHKTVYYDQQGHNVLNICLPGSILFNDHTENGFFIYGFYEEENHKICYHRTFTKAAQNNFLMHSLQEGMRLASEKAALTF